MAARKKGEPPNQSKAVKKRQYEKRTPQARANEKKTQAYSRPGKITQAGVGNIPLAAARLGFEVAKKVTKSSKPKPKAGSKITKAGGGRSYANTEAKSGVKSGQLPGGGKFAPKSVSPKKTKAPTKPSARSTSAKYRGKKKK